MKRSQSYGTTTRTLIKVTKTTREIQRNRIAAHGGLQSARFSPVVFFQVLAARKTNQLIIARARKRKRSARMLANARKDHSILLSLNHEKVSDRVMEPCTTNTPWIIEYNIVLST